MNRSRKYRGVSLHPATVRPAEFGRRQVDQFSVGRPQCDPASIEIDQIGLDGALPGALALSFHLGVRDACVDHRQRQGQNPISHLAFLPMLHAATPANGLRPGIRFIGLFAGGVWILAPFWATVARQLFAA